MDGVFYSYKQSNDNDTSKYMTDGEIPEQRHVGFWHSANRKNGYGANGKTAFAAFPLAERYYIKTIKIWDRMWNSKHPTLLHRKVGARVYIHEHENAS